MNTELSTFGSPLRLQASESRPSILSYWSDNMSVGPNLPLHTLSKPAIWLLYHLQARKYIKTNQNQPLSEAMIIMFDVYLGYKYISSATKTMILQHLCERLQGMELEACFRASEMFRLHSRTLEQWLESPDSQLGQLATHLLREIPGEKLRTSVLMINHTTLDVFKAINFLDYEFLPHATRSRIVQDLARRVHWLHDIQFALLMHEWFPFTALDKLNDWHDIMTEICIHLSSQDCSPETRLEVWSIITSHLGHDSDLTLRILTVIEIFPVSDNLTAHLDIGAGVNFDIARALTANNDLLPKLLQHEAFNKLQTCRILSKLTKTEEAAQVIVHGALHTLARLLLPSSAPSLALCIEICRLFHSIAMHETTYHALLHADILRFLFWLSRPHQWTAYEAQALAIHTLSELARWPEGADTLLWRVKEHFITSVLHSGTDACRRSVLHLIGNLALHHSLPNEHKPLDKKHIVYLPHIVDLLRRTAPGNFPITRHGEISMVKAAFFALNRICLRPGGLKMVRSTPILFCLPTLVEFLLRWGNVDACLILIQLGRRRRAAFSELDLEGSGSTSSGRPNPEGIARVATWLGEAKKKLNESSKRPGTDENETNSEKTAGFPGELRPGR
ncbi:hypothetical protein R3P38DRAFT_1961149 [Favolaschia claudopus]|uniref:Uncharacterized protein n=1 Tax=Favolaschia claudopus TaxID=2862362 RepID=A0AAV9ZYP6_9AGAR